MKRIFRLTAIIALLLICVAVQAQRRNSRYNEYIKQYADVAEFMVLELQFKIRQTLIDLSIV